MSSIERLDLQNQLLYIPALLKATAIGSTERSAVNGFGPQLVPLYLTCELSMRH